MWSALYFSEANIKWFSMTCKGRHSCAVFKIIKNWNLFNSAKRFTSTILLLTLVPVKDFIVANKKREFPLSDWLKSFNMNFDWLKGRFQASILNSAWVYFECPNRRLRCKHKNNFHSPSDLDLFVIRNNKTLYGPNMGRK